MYHATGTFSSVEAACVQESEVVWKYLKVTNWLKSRDS